MSISLLWSYLIGASLERGEDTASMELLRKCLLGLFKQRLSI